MSLSEILTGENYRNQRGKSLVMRIISKQFLVLISGQNMNNVHSFGKLALGHNSTLVSEAEEIQEI